MLAIGKVKAIKQLTKQAFGGIMKLEKGRVYL